MICSITRCHRGSAHPNGQALRSDPQSGLAIRRGAAGQFLVAGVLVGVLAHHGFDDGLVRIDPIGDDIPLLAVPAVNARAARAFVVKAGGAQGLHDGV